ncbi:MAG: DUF2461 domain-containing protein [Pyrinomonadaceae bacterium]
MLERETLAFLEKLEKNNSREWFNANKTAFESANANVTAFTGSLIDKFGKFDPEIAGLDPKACVFRIYRDIRFSKDKSPYKTNLGAYIAPGGRKSMAPGYYFHVQPGRCFFAGGKHIPDGSELLKIRNAIVKNTDEFLKIINKKSFRDTFGELQGDKLKSPPKGFDTEHNAVEYLKLKEFMAFVEFPNEKELSGQDFPKSLAKIAKEMFPLVTFLRKALKN